jgi:hypothetical protein
MLQPRGVFVCCGVYACEIDRDRALLPEQDAMQGCDLECCVVGMVCRALSTNMIPATCVLVGVLICLLRGKVAPAPVPVTFHAATANALQRGSPHNIFRLFRTYYMLRFYDKGRCRSDTLLQGQSAGRGNTMHTVCILCALCLTAMYGIKV